MDTKTAKQIFSRDRYAVHTGIEIVEAGKGKGRYSTATQFWLKCGCQ